MSDTKVVTKTENKPEKSFDVGSWLIPIIAVLVAMFLAAILMKLQGSNPITAYKSLFKTAFGSLEGIGVTLGKSTPLVLSGLAVAVGLRAGLFNIGAQGQLLSGALAAAWAGVSLQGLPGYIHIPIALIAGAFFGSVVAGISGFLKAYRGVHEVITTIMLNSIVMAIADYLASHQLREPDQFLTRTSEILPSAKMPVYAHLPLGFFIAVASDLYLVDPWAHHKRIPHRDRWSQPPCRLVCRYLCEENCYLRNVDIRCDRRLGWCSRNSRYYLPLRTSV